MMNTITAELRGTTPLMLKSDRTVDPFDPYAVKMKEITDKKTKKTDADVRMLRRLEWEAGLYFDEEIGPYVPGWNVIRCIQDGAKMSRKGKDVIRGVTGPDVVPILYKGPRTLDAMYEAGDGRRFVDVRRVVNNGRGGATMRARPIFREWLLNLELEYDENVISNERDLLAVMSHAGRFAGLGEYRPSSPKGGHFGRFTVEQVKARKAA